jgi:hypothetical protein
MMEHAGAGEDAPDLPGVGREKDRHKHRLGDEIEAGGPAPRPRIPDSMATAPAGPAVGPRFDQPHAGPAASTPGVTPPAAVPGPIATPAPGLTPSTPVISAPAAPTAIAPSQVVSGAMAQPVAAPAVAPSVVTHPAPAVLPRVDVPRLDLSKPDKQPPGLGLGRIGKAK